jgi:hypothetical protein
MKYNAISLWFSTQLYIYIYIYIKLKSNQKPEKSNQIWFEKFKLKKPK